MLPIELVVLICKEVAQNDAQTLLNLSHTCKMFRHLLEAYRIYQYSPCLIGTTCVETLIALKAGHPLYFSLHKACELGNAKMVEMLLYYGAQPELLNTRNENVCFKLISKNSLSLHYNLLIKMLHFVDINQQDIRGQTILALATRYQPEWCHLLLKAGADPNVTLLDGTSCLHISVERNDKATTRLLLDHQARHTPNQSGETPLFTACKSQSGILNLLLEYGVDVNVLNQQGWSPLHTAVEAGHLPLVKSLIQSNCFVNVQDIAGLTPLAVCKDPSIAHVLLLNGADLNLTSHQGVSPLQRNVMANQLYMVQFLLKNGAQYTSSSVFGSPKEVAKKRGFRSILAALEKYYPTYM